jgi:hypothetical protein
MRVALRLINASRKKNKGHFKYAYLSIRPSTSYFVYYEAPMPLPVDATPHRRMERSTAKKLDTNRSRGRRATPYPAGR